MNQGGHQGGNGDLFFLYKYINSEMGQFIAGSYICLHLVTLGLNMGILPLLIISAILDETKSAFNMLIWSTVIV